MILVECNADVALVESLGIGRREREHSGDKGRVCKKVKKSSGAAGLVDEDPGSPSPDYMAGLRPVFERHDIRVLADASSRNRVIVLCPELEVWLLETARQASLTMGDCGLPAFPTELHDILGDKPEKMGKLVETLKQKKSVRLRILEDLLKTQGRSNKEK
ncbi:MAG TPA: hypothetical protein VNK24_07805 [Elusimicrobiota bacterium]|nr:hypothetical protein [Elusimicrobiota bacterium]